MEINWKPGRSTRESRRTVGYAGDSSPSARHCWGHAIGRSYETPKTITAWQTSLDCRLDDIGRKECKRQGHLDRALGLALPESERLRSVAGIGDQFVQPAKGAAERFDDDGARIGAHRAGVDICIVCRLND